LGAGGVWLSSNHSPRESELRNRVLFGFDQLFFPRVPFTRKGHAISVRRQSRQQLCSRYALTWRTQAAAAEKERWGIVDYP